MKSVSASGCRDSTKQLPDRLPNCRGWVNELVALVGLGCMKASLSHDGKCDALNASRM